MSVVHTVATRTSTVEMPVTFTFLHRSSQVKFSYRGRKTSFGVRVRANGLRARALIRSSVGLRPTDT